MRKRTPDEDLDEVLRSGAGRRFLARLISDGLCDTGIADTPERTAFNLGLASASRTLDRRLRAINPDAWLLMHSEMLKEEADDETEVRHDDG